MPVIKDYYRILDIKPAASQQEIKTAYRMLALKYHPDRNPDDEIAATVFTHIAEAYTVLSNNNARKEYNEKRYATAAEEYKKPVETIETLIKRIQLINKQIKNSDPFRFNKDALLYSIKQLFPEDISLFLHTNDRLIKQFLEMVVKTVYYLSSHQIKQLVNFLQPLYEKNEWLQQNLHVILQQKQKQERWEKNKIILVVIIALLLCIVIFLTAVK